MAGIRRAIAAVAISSAAGIGLAQDKPATPPRGPTPELFASPPSETRPHVMYAWMDGNVTQGGLDSDLTAMRDIGLGGLVMRDVRGAVPGGPVALLGREWLGLATGMMAKSDQLGLAVGVADLIQSSGSWIEPEQAAQQLTWSETTVTGGEPLLLSLPRPFSRLGYYRDAAIVAFPVPDGHDDLHATASKEIVDEPAAVPSPLADDDPTTGVNSSPLAPVELASEHGFTAQAVTVRGSAKPFEAEIESSDDGVTWVRLGRVRVGDPGDPDRPGTLNFAAVTAHHFRIVPNAAVRITEARIHATLRIEGWPAKSRREWRGTAHISGDQGPQHAIDPAQVVDLSANTDAAGNLAWTPPVGRWTILRIGHTPLARLGEKAEGLSVDALSGEAVERHFDAAAGRLAAAAKGLTGKTLKALTISADTDNRQNWSAGFPEAFRKRNGYVILPYLPALTGRIVGDLDTSNRFLFDFRRTLADLVVENYLGGMQRRAKSVGLALQVEGDPGALHDALRMSGLGSAPTVRIGADPSPAEMEKLRIATSAGHVYGKTIIVAEAFIGDPRISRWEAHPYALKASGDRLFAAGVNQIVINGAAHQPNPGAAPGMSIGPAGVHLGKTNTWVPQSKRWIEYIARSQYLLRQGIDVADVLYFIGEDGSFGTERGRREAASALGLPPGYGYDLIDASALLSRVSVKDSQVVLPNGARYRLLVLPTDLKGMTPPVAKKMRELVEAGMAVAGPKPLHPLTLVDGAQGDAAFRAATDAVWDNGKAPRRYGAGYVFPSGSVADALDALKIQPDADCRTARSGAALLWRHRKLSGGDMYFVANPERRAERVTCTFRVGSAAPSLWDAESGTISRPATFKTMRDATQVSFDLGPAGSTFVMLEFAAGAKRTDWVAKDGTRFVDLAAKPAVQPKPPIDTFTLSLWAKPEASLPTMPLEAESEAADTPHGLLIPAEAGENVAAAGLALGRNGAVVIERTAPAKSAAVLVSQVPVAGWTHVALVYDRGRPSLYLNGKLARTGLRSGRSVQAGGSTASPAGLALFIGDATPLRTEPRAMTPAEIAADASAGVPPRPLVTTAAEITRGDDGRLHALVWESGDYSVGGGGKFKAEVPTPMAVPGPWTVTFQPGRGAPDRIELDRLTSLSRHADAGVRHYAGAATYSRTIEVPGSVLKKGRRVFVDLGRVEVLAGVTVNGRDLGTAWKEPYRIDITDAVRAGSNSVVLTVTNQWTNRLIGDAALPAEGKFVDSPWPVEDLAGVNGKSRGENVVRRITAFPDWYRVGKPQPPGGRVGFTPWASEQASDPLLDSGLLGPVRLVFATMVTIK